MKLKYSVAVLVAAAVVGLAFMPLLVKGRGETRVTRETVYVSQPALSSQQIIWLARLMQCESGIKATAINFHDSDNTPSYGILQFKPSTYAQGAVAYGLASTTDYMNPVGQITIVTGWLLDGGVDWHHQFPACVDKLGLPPTK